MRTSLAVLSFLTLAFVANLVIGGRLVHWSAQTREFNRLRKQLALGTAPTGGVDSSGHLVAVGTPIAVLNIPSLHTHEVVGEGTSGAALMNGPGHLRTTVFPGEEGTSVVFGRASSYGGPFGNLADVRIGGMITTTTAVGKTTFKVIDIRRSGDPLPPPVAAGRARLTLVTATGSPFFPSGVLRVDADSTDTAEPAGPIGLTSVPRAEQPMGTDTSALWRLALLLEVLILLAGAAVWVWLRWGLLQTWIIFVPTALLVYLLFTGEVARCLPNLL